MTRTACPRCGAAILEGAQKCRACRAWLVERSPPGPRRPRAAWIMGTTLFAVTAVLATSRRSPVGEAPPLTVLASAEGASASAPPPRPLRPPEEPRPVPPPAPRAFRARELRLDVHPLDVVFAAGGESLYVSGDDGSLREYRVKGGELLRKVALPAQGDHLRLLFRRYLAVLRTEDSSKIPILDTEAWEKDPILLDAGLHPSEVIELPDGQSVVTSTRRGKRVCRFDLATGRRTGDITLPHATGQLFLVRSEGTPHVAAMGGLTRGGVPAGAWIDLFDPEELPFGATRRSVSVGREPQTGAVLEGGTALFFPDRVANLATLLDVAASTELRTVAVGRGPAAAFLLGGDRWGVTINAGAKTATVIEMARFQPVATLMLDGTPRRGAASADGTTLFVSLGGSAWPPEGSGVAILGGDPPELLATLATGSGANAVAVSDDGRTAAVTAYWDRSVSLIEPATSP